jgi:murein tripeptide amidase MpaA
MSEWASPATVMYLTHKLLNSSFHDAKVQDWLNRAEIYVLPQQNPDGYVYTGQTGRGKRLWRKNRAQNADGSIGVDLNRNWDDGKWGEYGASSYGRSDTYQGPSPFSEPETRAVSEFIMATPNRVAGIDFHSYSQLILRNWGWSRKNSKNEYILKILGDEMAEAVYILICNLYVDLSQVFESIRVDSRC